MSSFLPQLSTEQLRLTIAITAGVGILAGAGLAYAYRKYLENSPPKTWRRVGELSDLICYPIKSCGPIRVDSIGCSKIGLENGYMRDRIFMVITTKGEFITGRQYPKMVLIQPRIEGGRMKLSAPGMMEVEIDIERLQTLNPIKCAVWGQVVDAIDCGEEVARWLSRYVLCEDYGLRLVFYPKKLPTRDVREKNRIFDTMHKNDSGAFHDATSFMLINESSLNDLNTRIENSASVLQFRPNFVVKGPLPYEEDYWKWVKIGEKAIFRNIKPCTRCLFTNIDPETAQRSPDGNPLKTLKQYRQFPNFGESPVLGAHLGLRVPGKILLGDAVYVNAN